MMENREQGILWRCPYFQEGATQNFCAAYPEGLMIPSQDEEVALCTTFSHGACPLFLETEKGREVNILTANVGDMLCCYPE